ncbi:AAA family ATPase [Candidatus Parabeggiatoa sp. HSG14]|uniref:AAA family ATPase n=1 Tax=Candidatus Parabeggiatoa sp. HSG14 TaxID=3055593 RepID=UPI0025A751F1|nr:AAA family ATPase [Thiotrichales bacterium HSG14]
MSIKLGRLDQLQINGYKSIKYANLKLTALNILIGSNGAGKSNFINFFKFIKKILDKDLPIYTAEQGGANRLLHFGKKMTDEITFDLLFIPNGYAATLITDVNDRLIFKSEKTYSLAEKKGYSGGTKNHSLQNAGGSNSKLPSRASSSSIEGHIVRYLQDWKVYHFHDTSVSARMKQTCNIHDDDVLASDGANLAAFLRSIRESHQKSYNQIIRTISRVAPFFQDFILEPESNNKETIKLKWKHKDTDEYFDANDLSDGTLRFICLTTLLLQPHLPTIILLDEPELGLHPFALNILASIFRKVSINTQIICSTQSVTFTDNFNIEDIVVVDRVNNHTVFKRLDKDKYDDWLEEYSLGEIWQKNLIGGVPTYD